MSVDARERELELKALIIEQAKELQRGTYQPPESFENFSSTISLNSFTVYGNTVDFIKPLNSRKKRGCALHGYTYYVQYGLRWVCKVCANDRSREHQRKKRRAARKEVT